MRIQPVANGPESIIPLQRYVPLVLGLILFLTVPMGQRVLLAQPGGPVSFPEGSVDNVQVRAYFTLVGPTGAALDVGLDGILSVNRTDPQVDPNGGERIELEIVALDLWGDHPVLGPVSLEADPNTTFAGIIERGSNPQSPLGATATFELGLVGTIGNLAVESQSHTVVIVEDARTLPIANWKFEFENEMIFVDPSSGIEVGTLVPDPDDREMESRQNPSFSVDFGTVGLLSAATIYRRGNPPVPGLEISPRDNIDALCYGVSVTDPGRNVIFSVAPGSPGAAGTAVRAAASAPTPYQSSSEFAGIGLGGPGSNSLVVPNTDLVLAPADDLDALDNFPPNFVDFDNPGDLFPERPVYYSLSAGDPSIGQLVPDLRPGVPDGSISADDILVFAPGVGPAIYGSGNQDIGLISADPANGVDVGDDLDALVMMTFRTWEQGAQPFLLPGQEQPLDAQGNLITPITTDLAFFSLAPGSPSLAAGGFNAADIFVTNFNGSFALMIPAANIGLTAEDNLNAMKFMLSSWHGSVDVPGNPPPTGGSIVTVTIGDGVVAVDLPTVATGGGFTVAETVADALNNSSFFQARSWLRASAHYFNSGLLTIIGAGPCNTIITVSDPGIVIEPIPVPLPFPLIPAAGGCPGDECDDPIPAVLGFNPFDTTDCTNSTDPYDDTQCPNTFLGNMNQDIWFTYTADECGVLRVSTCGFASFDTDLVGYYAFSCTDKYQIACNGDGPNCPDFTSEMEFPVSAGNKYLIRLGGFDDGAFGNGELFLDLAPATTLGDECVDAIPASLGFNWVDTTCATTSADAFNEDQCPGTFLGAVANDVWYVYTPDADGSINVRTCNTVDFDSSIVVYTGACDGLIQIGCNGDGVDSAGNDCLGFTSAAEDIPIINGDTIFIRVGGYFPDSRGKGLLELEYRQNNAPAAVEELDCSSDCTEITTLTWSNAGTYDAINIYVNGTLVDTLGGSDTSYSYTGISGARTMCVEPVAGGLVAPQACCEVFGLTPPPENVNCDPGAASTDVVVAWTNPVVYNAIEVWVNGVAVATLPGTETNFVVVGGVGRVICVRGLIANCWSELKCCDDTGTTPGIGEISCDPNQTNGEVAVSWTNPGFYSSIEVTLNGVLVQTLSGTADFTTVSGVTGTREICVTGILVTGAPTEPACCIVDVGGPTEPTFRRGDINHDAGVDIADAIALLGQLFSGGATFGCEDARDVNDDGTIDIADAIKALGYLFLGGSIPAPGPVNCGPDPTVDALPLCVYTPCP
ncbi:MAG: hypothetical protein VX764_04705 [Planctomycetota bacterium]|nr:hypothetical protein [Planctomycetota bacterium]